MKLDARQTRRLLLAGAVAFPKPFPSIGRISLERGRLAYSKSATQRRSFVVVQDDHEPFATRLILRSGVAAIFFPGSWVTVARRGSVFRFSQKHAAYNLERGEWFLGPDINVTAIRERLRNSNLRIDKRGGPARGIVFVYRDKPVMTITEVVQTAGSIHDYTTMRFCCDPLPRRGEPGRDAPYCCDCWGCDCPTDGPAKSQSGCDSCC